jgi:hypothetical protein
MHIHINLVSVSYYNIDKVLFPKKLFHTKGAGETGLSTLVFIYNYTNLFLNKDQKY